MTVKKALAFPGDLEPCTKCGQRHVRKTGKGTEYPSCTAHKTTGEPCFGTRRRGQKVCGIHGGKNQNSTDAAQRRLQEAEAKALLETVRKSGGQRVQVTSYADELLDTICENAGHVRWLRDMATAVDAESVAWGLSKQADNDVVVGDGKNAHLETSTSATFEAKPNVWWALYDHWSDKHAKLLVEAIRIGLDERRVVMAEREGQMVAHVIKSTADAILEALKAAGLPIELERVFTATLHEAAPRHLRSLRGDVAS